MDPSDADSTSAELLQQEIKELKEQLAKAEQLALSNSLLLRYIRDAVVVVDGQGMVTYWNDAAEQLFGFARERAVGQPLHELLKWRFRRPDSQHSLAALVRENGFASAEFEVSRGDREQLVVEASIAWMPGGEGWENGAICVMRDVTRQTRDSDAIRTSNDKLYFHLDNTPIAFVEWDSQFRVTRWSKRAEQIFGYSSDQMVGRDERDLGLLHPDDYGVAARAADELRRGEAPRSASHNRNITADGRVIHCEWYNSAQFDAQGGMVSALSLVLDVTEQWGTRLALEESERKFRALFNSALEPILVADDEGRYINANKAVCQAFGLEQSEVIGKTFADFIPSDFADGAKEAWAAFLEAGRQTGEVELAFPSGERKLFEYCAIAHFVPGQHLSVLRDISERRRHERERERLIVDLRAAVDQIRTLRGLLPVCAACRRVKDDGGAWTTLESFVEQRSQAEFSHGICPDCARELYPDLLSDVER